MLIITHYHLHQVLNCYVSFTLVSLGTLMYGPEPRGPFYLRETLERETLYVRLFSVLPKKHSFTQCQAWSPGYGLGHCYSMLSAEHGEEVDMPGSCPSCGGKRLCFGKFSAHAENPALYSPKFHAIFVWSGSQWVTPRPSWVTENSALSTLCCIILVLTWENKMTDQALTVQF